MSLLSKLKQVYRISFLRSLCGDMGGKRKKEKDEVSLTFDIASPNENLARLAISSPIERVPNNYVVVPELFEQEFETKLFLRRIDDAI